VRASVAGEYYIVTDEWRLTEHSVDVAMTRGRMWLVEAAHSLERARHGEQMYELILGTMAFVQAVHRLRQCVAMAAKYATWDGVADHFVIALKRFDTAVPGVKQVRDALEHSNEYLMGVGDAQQQGDRSKRLPDERQSRDWAFVPEYEDGDMERPVVTVGPHAIALVSALKAAETPWDDLYRGAQVETSSMPSGGSTAATALGYAAQHSWRS